MFPIQLLFFITILGNCCLRAFHTHVYSSITKGVRTCATVAQQWCNSSATDVQQLHMYALSEQCSLALVCYSLARDGIPLI